MFQTFSHSSAVNDIGQGSAENIPNGFGGMMYVSSSTGGNMGSTCFRIRFASLYTKELMLEVDSRLVRKTGESDSSRRRGNVKTGNRLSFAIRWARIERSCSVGAFMMNRNRDKEWRFELIGLIGKVG